MKAMVEVRSLGVYGWLQSEIRHIRRERNVDEIVDRVIKDMQEANVPLGLIGAVCAIGGYIYGHKKPIETMKVIEALADEYSENSIRTALWAGRKAGIFQGGFKYGLVYFTKEFAKFLGLPVYNLTGEMISKWKHPTRRKVMQTAAH